MPAAPTWPERQRVGQRRLVDQPAAGGVDDDHAGLGGGQLLRADQAQRLRGLRQVDGDEVRLASSSSSDQPDAELGGPAGLDVGVVGDERDAEGGEPLGDEDADAAETDDTDGLVGDLDAGELRPLPRSLAQRGVGGRDLPGGGEQQRDGVLGGGDDVRLRRVHDQDAALGGRRHVDVVQPDAGAGDDLQVRGRRQRLGVDLRGGADHDGGRVGERRQQGGAVGAVDVPDLDVVPSTSRTLGASSSAIRTTGGVVVTGRQPRSHPGGERHRTRREPRACACRSVPTS